MIGARRRLVSAILILKRNAQMKYDGSDISTKHQSGRLPSTLTTTWAEQKLPTTHALRSPRCQAVLSGFMVDFLLLSE